jgi:hypothetical protein
MSAMPSLYHVRHNSYHKQQPAQSCFPQHVPDSGINAPILQLFANIVSIKISNFSSPI